MPTYEYRCPKCNRIFERICRIAYRNEPYHCGPCRTVRCERILTVPHPGRWNDQEWFPNLDKVDDRGKQFPDRATYQKFLDDNEIREIGVPKPMQGKGGRRKIAGSGKRDTQPLPPRGAW